MNESIWNHLPTHTGFSSYYPNNGENAPNQTVIKMFHNGKSLFVSAVYQDTTPKTQINSLKRDGSIGTSDALVMMIDPYNKQQLTCYFASNVGGVQVDGLVEAKGNGFHFNKNLEQKNCGLSFKLNYRFDM